MHLRHLSIYIFSESGRYPYSIGKNSSGKIDEIIDNLTKSFPNEYFSPTNIFPQRIFFPNEYFSPTNIFPRRIFFPDEYFSPTNIFPRRIFFPDEYVSPTNIFPRRIFFPDEYFSPTNIFPRRIFFPDEYFSPTNIFPRRIFLPDGYFSPSIYYTYAQMWRFCTPPVFTFTPEVQVRSHCGIRFLKDAHACYEPKTYEFTVALH